jgi:methyl-accepting chemotaxis protein
MASLRISTRLWLLAGFSFALFLVAIAVGLYGIKIAERSLRSVYEERAVPMDQLASIEGILRANRAEALLALQHDPSSLTAKLHDHPVQTHLDAISVRVAEADKLWREYMKNMPAVEERQLAEDFEDKRAAWVKKLAFVLDSVKAEEFGFPLLKHLLEASRFEFAEAMSALAKLRSYQVMSAKQEYESAVQRYEHTLVIFVILTVIGVAGLFFLARLAQRRINGGLKEAAEIARAIAAGDLSGPLPSANRDEIGELMIHVDAMRDSLSRIVVAMRQNVDALNHAAGELSQAATASQSASEAQSESASSMAAAIEQLSVSIDHVRGSAQEAHGVAAASDSQAREGGEIINRAAAEMEGIADSVNTLAETIRDLGQLSGQISGIVGAIKEVSDQTNLLALNAAIEAARAGEQGRGFAVVADEVRKLAERTGKSTEEIGAMIEKIQAGMRAATLAMDRGVARVSDGVSLASEAGQSVAGIRDGAAHATRAVEDINAALHEQSVAAREIAQRVELIAQGAEKNSAAAAQTATSAYRLETLGHELGQIAGQFRLG